MKVVIQEVDACKKQLNIEIPRDIVNKEIDLAYNSIKNKASLPGFRKGKVPRKLLEKHYSQSIHQDVLQKMIPETYEVAIKEHKVKVVGQPLLDDVKMEDDSPLSFTATVDVLPQIDLKEYTGFEFTKQTKKISDKTVDEELKKLQERFAEFESIEDKAVENTDYVLIDIEPINLETSDNEKLSEKNYPVIVGNKSTIPEVDEGLLNMKKGEEKEIIATFKDDYSDKNFAGKEVTFKLKVNEIKVKKLKEIDNSFAKELAGCETVDELKEKIKKELELVEIRNVENKLNNDVLAKLVEDNKFDAPKVLLDKQIKSMLEDAMRQNYQMGQTVDPEHFTNDENVKKAALQRVKEDILLDLISDKENLAVDDKEVDEQIEVLSKQNNMEFHTAKSNMNKNGSYETFRDNIRRAKVLKEIIKKSKINDIYIES